MKKFWNEILTGEEIAKLRQLVKGMSMAAQLGAMMAFLLLLDLLPRFTLALAILIAVSLGLTHFLRKWAK